MLAVPAESVPAGPGWAFEPKWDGWRAITVHDGRGVRLYSRAGRSLSGFFPDITRLVRASLPAGVMLDGVISSQGWSDSLSATARLSCFILRHGHRSLAVSMTAGEAGCGFNAWCRKPVQRCRGHCSARTICQSRRWNRSSLI